MPASAQASAIFNGDFEPGNMSQWAVVQNCATTRNTAYSAATQPTWPAPVSGTFANRTQAAYTDHWTGPGNQACDTSSGSRRAQQGSTNILAPNTTVWEGFWTYVPTNFNAGIDGSPDRWFVMQEDFGAPFSGPPPYSFDIGNVNGVQSFMLDKVGCGGGCQTTAWSKPIAKGAWHHFVVQKRISADDTTAGGSHKLWFDNVQQTFTAGTRSADYLTAYGRTLATNASENYRFYLNTYFGKSVPTISAIPTLYFDGARVGTTRADADLPASAPAPAPAPQAAFTWTPAYPLAGSVVQFDASTSKNAASYSWSMDGLTTLTGVKPTFTFKNAGTKKVTLTVTAAGGATSSISRDVVVSQWPTSNDPLPNSVRQNDTTS
ncbi:hypothetical protein DSM104329_04821 [Capillimicrobium parvum]|uniref:PKD domain-containing protein n=1 Tax=Capillimicrobium parvum TaxID=2884022 RepID=A0A9E6Y1V7_9ACTN|nr:hypothetical protein DSM104329_04821 [Capillimicrobium parvum]